MLQTDSAQIYSGMAGYLKTDMCNVSTHLYNVHLVASLDVKTKYFCCCSLSGRVIAETLLLIYVVYWNAFSASDLLLFLCLKAHQQYVTCHECVGD